MITRRYIDPLTGAYSDRPTNIRGVTFATIHFQDPSQPGVLLEHVLDEDIHSLSVNIVTAHPRAISEMNRLNAEIFAYLNNVLPSDTDVGVETSEDGSGVYISIPDFSRYPMLQSEFLAEELLRRTLLTIAKK